MTNISHRLSGIESDFNVKILYAAESGSRAWGFSSPDSDFDVRFIYIHSHDYYLSIDEQRDVIELPVNEVLDINGWELRKALRLFKKSNGPLFESTKGKEKGEALIEILESIFGDSEDASWWDQANDAKNQGLYVDIKEHHFKSPSELPELTYNTSKRIVNRFIRSVEKTRYLKPDDYKLLPKT